MYNKNTFGLWAQACQSAYLFDHVKSSTHRLNRDSHFKEGQTFNSFQFQETTEGDLMGSMCVKTKISLTRK